MQTIWKFPLEVTDEQVIEMPKGANIISLQTQFDTPCIWAIVNPDASKEKRTFFTIGTGHKYPNFTGLVHIGSYSIQGGVLVFHVFELK